MKTSLNSPSPVIWTSGRTCDPVLLHVHQEVGEALVLGGVGVGAGDEHAPLRELGEGRPDLLPGDDPFVAVLDRAGLQRGEVGAGLGLGEALAPDLLGGEDRLQVALLLLVGAVGDDHRAAHRQAEDVGRAAAPPGAPPRRRRSPARSASRRGRRTPSARRSRPSRPRAACAATRGGRPSPRRGRPPARARDGSPRARCGPRRGTPARMARGVRSIGRGRLLASAARPPRPAGSASRCRARRRSTSSPGPSPCRSAPSRAAGW